ncbi:MAG: hypothetical protein GF408_02350 [Candidatus Omnitrophica bacterium]|nr:hypothetical protein [Candidatus Omnitrophota bacterium]
MKLYRILAISLFVSLICAAYVHQRVEILKTSYELQENRRHLTRLIDQNSNLSYDLSKLESPGYLLAVLEKEGLKFAVKRGRARTGYILSHKETPVKAAKEGLVEKVMDMFTATAEAKPRT